MRTQITTQRAQVQDWPVRPCPACPRGIDNSRLSSGEDVSVPREVDWFLIGGVLDICCTRIKQEREREIEVPNEGVA
jgi:hypothetical protein